ncbi:MAG: hypothetical protein JKY56_18310 [Kofleriaceae bacterium]|nr:hypothetical protein [Kofleriaceae bacterium]
MSRRPALSLSLYLQDRHVLLFGDGEGADERAKRLERANASIYRITSSDWQELAESQNSANNFDLVIANSDDATANRALAKWARAQGILAYAHDQPEVSDFAFPALAHRGVLQIAISTQGVAPALAAQLRRHLSALLDSGGQELDRIAKELEELREKFPRGSKRMNLLKQIAKRVRHVGKLTIDDEEI